MRWGDGLCHSPNLAKTATSHIDRYPLPTMLTDTWLPGIGGLHSDVQTSPAASCLTRSPHIGFCLWSVRIPTRISKLDNGLDRVPVKKEKQIRYMNIRLLLPVSSFGRAPTKQNGRSRFPIDPNLQIKNW